MAATGWKFRQHAATSELMIAGGCADLRSPRQEEHSSNSRRDKVSRPYSTVDLTRWPPSQLMMTLTCNTAYYDVRLSLSNTSFGAADMRTKKVDIGSAPLMFKRWFQCGAGALAGVRRRSRRYLTRTASAAPPPS